MRFHQNSVEKALSPILLENDEAAGRTDEGWTVVQSRSTIKSGSKASSIVNASAQGRQRSEMMPAESNKHFSASRSYAEVLKGERVRRLRNYVFSTKILVGNTCAVAEFCLFMNYLIEVFSIRTWNNLSPLC